MPKTGKHFVKFVTIIFKTTLNKNQGLKDRQQEAERGLEYLTLLSSYFMYMNSQYMK